MVLHKKNYSFYIRLENKTASSKISCNPVTLIWWCNFLLNIFIDTVKSIPVMRKYSHLVESFSLLITWDQNMMPRVRRSRSLYLTLDEGKLTTIIITIIIISLLYILLLLLIYFVVLSNHLSVCQEYFIIIFRDRLTMDSHLLDQMEKSQYLVFSPCKTMPDGKKIVPYDDR